MTTLIMANRASSKAVTTIASEVTRIFSLPPAKCSPENIHRIDDSPNSRSTMKKETSRQQAGINKTCLFHVLAGKTARSPEETG